MLVIEPGARRQIAQSIASSRRYRAFFALGRTDVSALWDLCQGGVRQATGRQVTDARPMPRNDTIPFP
jgi:hypothetical protein